MNNLIRAALIVGIAAAALGAGVWIGRRGNDGGATAATPTAAGRKVLYYRSPMGADTSPVPKKDPMGMQYVPVYEGGADDAPGTVVIDPSRVQALGVRTEVARRGPQTLDVRASATIAVDETRTYVVAPRFEGWVAHLYANQTGMRVRAGQPLLAVYSPPLAAARQEMALADDAARRLRATDAPGAEAMRRLGDASRTRMRNAEVDAAGSGNNVVFRSRVTGVVLEKSVLPGQRFMAGETILKVADLSRVWAVAHVPADQAGGVAPGQAARFMSSAEPGTGVTGRVTFVQPVIDPSARTVDVRVELPNGDGRLRPGLFGTLSLAGATIDALTVPTSAVIDSGTRQVVLVQRGEGRYAPREVAVGRRLGERVEILGGLDDGERVVTAANFLIDAESNLQSALQGLGSSKAPAAAPARSPATAPMPGMDMPPPDAGGSTKPAPAGHEGH